MPDIKITFEEVKAKTKQIRTHNEALNNLLQQIKSAINALETEWTSDTSDTIRSKITGMQPKFDSYKEVIESYAKFLDNTVAQYEQTESTLNTNAANQFI
ncbi:MAG: WXG100 family type VII secretion target [Oscillospiraceae bacterium]|jgi:WXG100 family type VII secretion target|nr:WXG100 family type VII secretion target [Oscillospiraceae bacterium]MCI9587134.1 WXG100 family type VII secretion target [Oscillospiraceae bacterium]